MFTLLIGQIFSKGNIFLFNLKKFNQNFKNIYNFIAFIAKVFMIILWIITAIDFDSTIPAGLKYFLCIFPNYSIVFAFQVINQFERSGK